MNSFLCCSKYFSLSTHHRQLIPLIREIMRHFVALLLLWTTNCKEIHAEHVVEGNTIRNDIRKIPQSSSKDTIDDEGWGMINIGKDQRMPGTQRSPLFIYHFDEMPSKNFLPVFNSHHRTVSQNHNYYNQSVHPGNGFRIDTSTAFTATSKPEKRNNNGEMMAGMKRPWRRTIAIRKMRLGQKPTAFRTTAVEIPNLETFKQDNLERVPLIPNNNNLQSSQLSLYQQRQQLYQQNQRVYNPVVIPATSRMQQFGVTQSTIYYNPWDPLGLLNNPFWKALFPGFSVPQPHSFSTLQSQGFAAPAPQISQSLDSQPVEITKKPHLTPNQKLALCCQKKRLSLSCQNLCSYDIFSDQSLITAVISNQCPGQELETAFNCATSMANHSACCIRKGIGAYNNGRCMVFCTTHLGNPRNTMQYIDCLRVFDGIKNCYREYHTTHPNIYGDF